MLTPLTATPSLFLVLLVTNLPSSVPAHAAKPARDRQGVVAGRLLGGHGALAITSMELTLDLAAWAEDGDGAARAKYVVQNDGASPIDVALELVAPPETTVVATQNGQPLGAARAPVVDAASVADKDDFEPARGAPFGARFAPGATELVFTHPLRATLWGKNAISTVLRVVHGALPKGPWKSVGPLAVHVVRPKGYSLTTAPELRPETGALRATLTTAPDLVQVRAQKVKEAAATIAGPMGGFIAFAIAFLLALVRWAFARRGPRTSKKVVLAWASLTTLAGCAAAFGIQLAVLRAFGVLDPGDDWRRYALMQFAAAFVLATLVVFAFLSSQNAKLLSRD